MDVKVYLGLNIHRLMDVKLNELPKQILMLLPLLLLLLLLLYVLYNVLIRGREAPPYNYVVSTYSRSSSRSSRGSSIKICFGSSFSLTSPCLGMLRALTSPKPLNILTSLRQIQACKTDSFNLVWFGLLRLEKGFCKQPCIKLFSVLRSSCGNTEQTSTGILDKR